MTTMTVAQRRLLMKMRSGEVLRVKVEEGVGSFSTDDGEMARWNTAISVWTRGWIVATRKPGSTHRLTGRFIITKRGRQALALA